jgi:hypothetical protein
MGRSPQTHEEDFDLIADGLWDNSEFLPENILQSEEMKNAVIDLIRALPDVQKTAVLLFYYEEMGVKEIAEIQECSVGTVKSRLNYARKYIKSEIEKRRKKGDYILSVVPLPLLTLILREMAARNSLAEAEAVTIFSEACVSAEIVITEAAVGLITTEAATATAAGSVVSTATVTAATKGGMTLLTKLIIGGVILCTVGVSAAVFLLTNSNEPEEIENYIPAITLEINEVDEPVQNAAPPEEEPAPVEEEPAPDEEEIITGEEEQEEQPEPIEEEEPELPAPTPEFITIDGRQFSTSLTLVDFTHWYLTEAEVFELRHMTNATHMLLPGSGIRDLTPLAGFTNLVFLDLHGNNVSDLTPLSNLTNLTRLDLTHNQISDLSPITSLTNLTDLDISYNPISDITPLSNLINLTSLFTFDCPITDWSPIAHLNVSINEFSDDEWWGDTWIEWFE